LIEEIIRVTETVLAQRDKQEKEEKKTNHHPPDGGGNKGHLIVDATVAPADIKFPTDHDLLNQAREKSELLIDMLHKAFGGKIKPRTYRQKTRAEYLSLAKNRNKSRKALNKGIGKQLRYLRRNLKTIEKTLDAGQQARLAAGQARCFPLAYKYQRTYWIIQELYRQQKQMYDNKSHRTAHRIVSISQPHIRPIVRGKSGKEVEFGAKISLSLANGSCSLHKISWDAYNESGDLKSQIETYKQRYGFYPEKVSADQLYGT